MCNNVCKKTLSINQMAATMPITADINFGLLKCYSNRVDTIQYMTRNELYIQ